MLARDRRCVSAVLQDFGRFFETRRILAPGVLPFIDETKTPFPIIWSMPQIDVDDSFIYFGMPDAYA